MNRRVPLSVWLGLAIAVGLDTIVEFTWKSATRGIPDSASMLDTISQAAGTPMFHLTAAFWIVQFLNWMLVLSKSDLSFAQPITSLSLVTVAITAQLSPLAEHVSLTRWIGIVLIVAGVWQISLAGHRTETVPAPALSEVPG